MIGWSWYTEISMVPYLTLLLCETVVSVKENPDEKSELLCRGFNSKALTQ